MEEGTEKNGVEREEIFSKTIRAGKRTYFLDVKSTRANELYLTITESKKRYSEDGKPIYEKHKVFLYKEDFEKFMDGLNEVIDYVKTNSPVFEPKSETPATQAPAPTKEQSDKSFSDVNFEDLDK